MASLMHEHELGQTPGDGEEQGGLACCSPWGCKESDMNGRLNNSSKGKIIYQKRVLVAATFSPQLLQPL